MFSFPTSFHGDLPGLQRRNPNLFPDILSADLPQESESGHLSQDSEDTHTSEEDSAKPKRRRKRNHPRKKATTLDNGGAIGIGPIMKITQSAYRAIMDDLVERPFWREKAGMLLGPTAEDDLVTHYIPDRNGQSTYSSFTLDATGLNKTLQNFKRVESNCKGVVHVHPPGVLQPSVGDLTYVAKLFANPKNTEATQVLLPIVSNGRLYPYLINAENPREVVIPRLILV